MRNAIFLAALGALSACAPNKVSIDQVAQPEIVVNSIPRGCTITVDGADRGATPLVFRAASREAVHQLELTKEGYLPSLTTVTGADVHGNSGQEIIVLLRPSTWDPKVKFAPEDPTHVMRAGQELARHERCPEAILFLQHAVQLEPRLANAHKTLGICYAKLKRNDKALDSYKAYLQHAPDAPDADKVRDIVSKAQGDIDL